MEGIKKSNEVNDNIERVLNEVLIMLSAYDYFYLLFTNNIHSKEVRRIVELGDLLYIINKFSEQISIDITNILE